MMARSKRPTSQKGPHLDSFLQRGVSLAIGLALGLGFMGLLGGDSTQPLAETTSRAHGSWAFDLEDDRLLVGFSDNVFFAQVLSAAPMTPQTQADGAPEDEFPQTSYSVLPLSSIKGELLAPITVIQTGGIDVDGTVVLLEGDSLMVVGATYLLVTQSFLEDGAVPSDAELVHYLVAPGFDHPAAATEAEVQALTSRFAAAYEQELDPRETFQEPQMVASFSGLHRPE